MSIQLISKSSCFSSFKEAFYKGMKCSVLSKVIQRNNSKLLPPAALLTASPYPDTKRGGGKWQPYKLTLLSNHTQESKCQCVALSP